MHANGVHIRNRLLEHQTVKLAVKIDVDSLRGTRIGVPRLVELLETQAAGATFLFSVGPDRSGTHLGRLFRRGMPGRLWRTMGIRNYGFLTFLYGSLIPGPDIGNRCADVMRSVRESGFETGVRAFDQIEWQENIALRNSQWIARQMELAHARYERIVGEPPRVHGAAGWQMNRYAYRFTQRLDFAYGSDTRGTHPFIPVYQAEIIACPQLPTTLPTLDELIGQNGINRKNIVEYVLELTKESGPWGHVFTGNAAFEGLKLLPEFEQLLRGWRQQGYEIVSLHDYMVSFDTQELPCHEVIIGTVAGRPGTVALQGKEFLT
jgi:undecaprenyl phosphate-alpha-L-ara4FN deformylase